LPWQLRKFQSSAKRENHQKGAFFGFRKSGCGPGGKDKGPPCAKEKGKKKKRGTAGEGALLKVHKTVTALGKRSGKESALKNRGGAHTSGRPWGGRGGGKGWTKRRWFGVNLGRVHWTHTKGTLKIHQSKSHRKTDQAVAGEGQKRNIM